MTVTPMIDCNGFEWHGSISYGGKETDSFVVLAFINHDSTRSCSTRFMNIEIDNVCFSLLPFSMAPLLLYI